MFKCTLLATSIALATPAWADGSAAASAAQDPQQASPITDPVQRAQAIRDIQEMKARIGQIERALGLSSEVPPPPVQATPVAAVSTTPKEHNLEVYGFVQLDAIQDFNRVNPDWEATLRPSRIPTMPDQFGRGGQSIFSVRQSRLGVKANGILGDKPYEAKFEFDLYGTGVDAGQTTMRVRHVYASWGPFLAGQTNSLFMDGDVFPNVIDYWGPAGMVFLRTPQIRWTFVNKNGWKAAVGLEHATNDIDAGNLRLIDEDIAGSIRNDEKMPDITAQVRYQGKWGHVQLAGILRRLGYETPGTEGSQPRGHRTGWGVDLTSSFNVALATLRLGAVYGRGIASYMNDGGMDFAPSVDVIPDEEAGRLVLVPRAEAVKLFGMTAYVDFNWSKKWTSALGYSYDVVDNTNFQDGSAFHRGQYASVNLLWHPYDKIFTGAELLWGKRTDNSGDSGKDVRLQYSFHWDFSSKNLWGLLD
jgi:hypothetical protein